MPGKVAIIIPVNNEAGVIAKTAEALAETFNAAGDIEYAVLIVDDGSTDGTWTIVETLSQHYPSLSGIRLSRNFGKENAILAGLNRADGDCAIIMDGDLQHPPETALQMYRIWSGGMYKIVEAVKKQRQEESAWHRFGAGVFYAALRLASGLPLKNMSDFKLLDRCVIEIILDMPERHLFFRAIPGWIGLETAYLPYDVAPRAGGETKFKPMRLMTLAVDSITSYSSLPLHMVTLLGLGFFFFSIVMAAQTLYMKLSGRSVEGFTTVILLLLMIGGILMVSLGIIGIYIAKIYKELKHRPRYIIGASTEAKESRED